MAKILYQNTNKSVFVSSFRVIEFYEWVRDEKKIH